MSVGARGGTGTDGESRVAVTAAGVTCDAVTAVAMTVAATAAWTSAQALRRWPPGGAARWARRNHRDEPVTLLEGPALASAAVATLLLPLAPARLRAAGVIAVLGAAAVGAYDDVAGDAGSKGLRGHLGALGRGQVTTGTIKVLGLAVTGVAATVVAGRRTTTVDALVGGAVVAGAANLVNLLDLRPGRALKALLLCAPLVPGAGRPLAAVAAGAAAGLLGEDLAERSMLGDAGAGAAGALLGVAVVAGGSRRASRVVLGLLTALTLTSERVSFSQVIESTPGLRELDRLGRRPARPPS